MSKRFEGFLVFLFCMSFMFSACSVRTGNEAITCKMPVAEGEVVKLSLVAPRKMLDDVLLVSEEEIRLIARVVLAEAEGEGEEGKRLVVDVILNRMESPYFPDTAYEVIHQPYHFSVMWNGRFERCDVRDDICMLVQEELVSRLNKDVIYFTAEGYSQYGVPMFRVGNHYFSSYD